MSSFWIAIRGAWDYQHDEGFWLSEEKMLAYYEAQGETLRKLGDDRRAAYTNDKDGDFENTLEIYLAGFEDEE